MGRRPASLSGAPTAVGKLRRIRSSALRVDKMTLAALEAVLNIYRAPDHLAERHGLTLTLTRNGQAIAVQAARLQAALQNAVGVEFTVSTVEMTSQIGSGAFADRHVA